MEILRDNKVKIVITSWMICFLLGVLSAYLAACIHQGEAIQIMDLLALVFLSIMAGLSGLICIFVMILGFGIVLRIITRIKDKHVFPR